MNGNRTVGPDVRPAPGVHRIEFPVDFPPEHVASYFLEGAEPILIDAAEASPDHADRLERALGSLGYDLADVDHVVCTHPHVDHVGLVERLIEAGGPTVYAPATYRSGLERSSADRRADMVSTGLEAGLPGPVAESVADWLAGKHQEIFDQLPADAVDVWYDADDTVPVGDRRFETVHTPGHQRDHCCLLTEIDGERSLFSGDVAVSTFRPAAVHAGLTAEQSEAITAYYETLDRLATRSVDRIYPGHGPVHDSLTGAIETARESLDRLLARTEDAVRPDGTHAGHAADARSGGSMDGPWLPEAIGALAHLERRGRLESTLEDGVRRYRPASD